MNSAFGKQLFLDRLEPLLAAGKLVFSPRNARKTWEFMLSEDLSAEDAIDMIARLRLEHHHKGPENDHDGTPGAVCAFLYPYKKIQVYIKIKIVTGSQCDTGAVLSFHDEDNYD